MKKYKIIGCFIIAIVSLLLLFDGDATNKQSLNALIPEIVFEGEYRVGDEGWKVYEKGEHISATKGDVDIKGELKLYYDGKEVGKVKPGTNIAFYGNHVAIEVIEGDIRTNVGPEIEQIYPASCEKRWCIYKYIGEVPDKIQIRVHNTHKYGNDNAVDEMLDNLEIYVPTVFEDDKMMESALQLVVALLVLVCVFALGGVYVFAKITHVKQSSRFLRMACFMLLAGLCMIFSDKNIALVIQKYTFNTLAFGVCSMLYMLCVIEMLCSYMNEEMQRKINKLLGVMHAVVITVMLIAVISDVLLYDLLFYWGIGQGLICIVTLGLILNEIISKKRIEHWSLSFAGLVCLAFLMDFTAVCSGFWNVSYASGIMFFALFARGCVVLVYKIPKNIKAAESAQKLEQELSDSRIALMMNQIRTHFIFNVMNAISGLCSTDAKKADEALIQFSRYLRKNTNVMYEDKPISFLKELQHLEDYVSLEQLRFGDRICFEKEIEINDFVLPPLTLQPLVENAIKYGFIEVGERGKVILSTRETEDEIEINIIDDGVGFELNDLEKERSVGVRNVRYRLERMVNGRLEIKSVIGKGTQVTIYLPKGNQI